MSSDSGGHFGFRLEINERTRMCGVIQVVSLIIEECKLLFEVGIAALPEKTTARTSSLAQHP
jgi:hypothetical protein